MELRLKSYIHLHLSVKRNLWISSLEPTRCRSLHQPVICREPWVRMLIQSLLSYCKFCIYTHPVNSKINNMTLQKDCGICNKKDNSIQLKSTRCIMDNIIRSEIYIQNDIDVNHIICIIFVKCLVVDTCSYQWDLVCNYKQCMLSHVKRKNVYPIITTHGLQS